MVIKLDERGMWLDKFSMVGGAAMDMVVWKPPGTTRPEEGGVGEHINNNYRSFITISTDIKISQEWKEFKGYDWHQKFSELMTAILGRTQGLNKAKLISIYIQVIHAKLSLTNTNSSKL